MIDTLEVDCPNCFSPAGQRCTQPTDTSRRPVDWIHSARLDAAEAKDRDRRG